MNEKQTTFWLNFIPLTHKKTKDETDVLFSTIIFYFT